VYPPAQPARDDKDAAAAVASDEPQLIVEPARDDNAAAAVVAGVGYNGVGYNGVGYNA